VVRRTQEQVLSRGAVADAHETGQTVLVLQGGGALGAYQVGVYQALHEAGIEPQWVIGTSIGAINGAIIAGNPPEQRLEKLSRFWCSVQGRSLGDLTCLWPAAGTMLSNLETYTCGVAGFFAFNPFAAWGVHMPFGLDRAAFYTTAPLRETLAGLTDFDYINARHGRLTLGAVNVGTGEMHYFDSRDRELCIEHVMASGALPPAFPAVRVDGEPYWDGGIYSNTPIEAVLDDKPRRNSLIFSANVWHPRGPEPESIWQVVARHKDIQFASRAKSHVARQQQIHRMRHIVRELGKHIPPEKQRDPEVRELLDYGCATVMHVIPLSIPRVDGEDHTKDIDFSPRGIRARWAAGYADTRRAIEWAPWRREVDAMDGIIVHEEVL
jgi:NTE family protein